MSIDKAASDLFDFITGPMTGVPVALKPKLKDTLHPRNHAHVGVVQAVEFIYRNAAVLPVPLLNLGIAMAEAAGKAGAGGLGADNRGLRIATAIRKRPGTTQTPAVDATDPAPLPDPDAAPAPAPTPTP